MKKATYFYLLRRGFLGGGGIDAIARAFRDRVETDDGIVEAIACLNKAVVSMPPADFGRVTFDAYSSRVTTDSGTTEARTCTINALNLLY